MIIKNRIIYVFPNGDLVSCVEIFNYLRYNPEGYVISHSQVGVWNGTELIMQEEKKDGEK